MAGTNKSRDASHDSPGIELQSSLGAPRAARSETFGFIATPPRRTWRPDIRTLKGSHRADGVECRQPPEGGAVSWSSAGTYQDQCRTLCQPRTWPQGALTQS